MVEMKKVRTVRLKPTFLTPRFLIDGDGYSGCVMIEFSCKDPSEATLKVIRKVMERFIEELPNEITPDA